VSERSVDQALDAGLSNIGFSLDGDEPVHNKIRGREDCFSRLMHAFELCAEKGLPTAVVTHLNTLNLQLLDVMAQILVDHGVRTWQIQLGFDAGNLSSHRELLIDPADLKWVIPKIARMKEKLAGTLKVSAADDIGYYSEDERSLRSTGHPIDFWVGCQAGMQVVGIEANGNIKGCLSMQTPEFVEGNVREESLKTIWTKEGNFAYTRNFTPEQLGGYCRECRYNEFCRGGCSWRGYIHGGRTGTYDNKYCVYRVCQLEEAGQLPVKS
jgi:radical SAM protein with 4Fe4S-binding SPASM domain